MQFEITVSQLQQLLPKAFQVRGIETQNPGVLGISLYDKNKDLDIEFNLYADGILISATPAMTYDKSIMTVEDLETAINDFYRYVRFNELNSWQLA